MAEKEIDNLMSGYAQGKLTAQQLRKGVKKLGYEVDSLRGNSPSITIFRPDGSSYEAKFRKGGLVKGKK